MKQIFIICSLSLLSSCSNSNSNTNEIDQLNQRINRLEQKIDSLLSVGNASSFGSYNKTKDNSVSYKSVQTINRCQAITKKGTQCKRTAKDNGYCWQHVK